MKKKLWLISIFPLRVLILLASVLDAIFRPIYRPVIRAISSLTFVQTLERRIGSLPRVAILVLLAVPYAIAEPLKVFGLVVMAHGHFRTGLTMVILAHLATFLIVERIYHAGREKLLTYAWLAWVMGYAGALRAFYDRVRLSVFNWIRLRILVS